MQVRRYASVFWDRCTELQDHDRVMAMIERGETKIKRRQSIIRALEAKVSSCCLVSGVFAFLLFFFVIILVSFHSSLLLCLHPGIWPLMLIITNCLFVFVVLGGAVSSAFPPASDQLWHKQGQELHGGRRSLPGEALFCSQRKLASFFL